MGVGGADGIDRVDFGAGGQQRGGFWSFNETRHQFVTPLEQCGYPFSTPPSPES